MLKINNYDGKIKKQTPQDKGVVGVRMDITVHG